MSTTESKRANPCEILVVENSAPDVFAVTSALERGGYAVTVVDNGASALPLLRDRPFQLVISGIDVPQINGIELSFKIKSDPKLQQIPVILLANLSKTEDLLDGLNAHADAYLTTPFHSEDLLARVKAATESPAELPHPEDVEALKIRVKDKEFRVNAGRSQILNLLLSTLDSVAQKNDELTRAQLELKSRNQLLREQGRRLKASERNFRALLESDAEGIAVVDQKGLVQFVNPAIESLLRKTSRELLGAPFQFALVPDETREVRIAYPNEESVVAELHVVDTIWEGELAYLASIRDITRRKQNEEHLIKAQTALKERNQKLQDQAHRSRATERNLRALLENSMDGMIVIDQRKIVRYANAATEILLRQSAEQLLNRPFEFQFAPDEASEFEVSGVDGEPVTCELRVVDTVWDGAAAYLAFVRDITERKNDEKKLIKARQILSERNEKLREQDRRLRISERNFRALLENNTDGMVVVDHRGAVRFANPFAELLLGRSAAELSSQPFKYALVPDETMEVEIPSSDGTITVAELHAVDTVWEGESAYLASIRDITKRKRDERKIREQQAQLEEVNARLQALATSDGLTGLKNHRTFKERVNEEFQRAVRFQLPLSLVLLDVDHFKQFNDTFGHPAGDEVLKRVARILENNSRSTDLVARYGGEEFVVILPYTDREESLQITERFRQTIAAADWRDRLITSSFGAASLIASMSDVKELISAADAALYHSKQTGRNRVSHAADVLSETA